MESIGARLGTGPRTSIRATRLETVIKETGESAAYSMFLLWLMEFLQHGGLELEYGVLYQWLLYQFQMQH